MNKVIASCLLVGLLSASIQAQQPGCNPFELPSQRQDDPVQVGSFSFVVPHSFPGGLFVGTYPLSLQYVFPQSAKSVGLISWSIFVPAQWPDGTPIPKSSVHVWGLRCGVYCAAVNFFNNDDEGLWMDDALSRPLHPSNTYMLGLFNYNKRDVTIEVVVSGQVCR